MWNESQDKQFFLVSDQAVIDFKPRTHSKNPFMTTIVAVFIRFMGSFHTRSKMGGDFSSVYLAGQIIKAD